MNSFTSHASRRGSAGAKFLFDTNFDAVGAADAADAADERQRALRSYSLSEIDAIRAGAFAEGKSAGQVDAQASFECRKAGALEAAAHGLAALMKSQAELDRDISRHAAAIGSALVRKLHPALARRHGLLEIEGLVGRCLERVRDEPRVVVRLNDAMLDELRPLLEEIGRAAGYDGRLVLIADDAIPGGDCRVEWADGGCERDCARLWEDIETVLERSLAGLGEPNEGGSKSVADRLP